MAAKVNGQALLESETGARRTTEGCIDSLETEGAADSPVGRNSWVFWYPTWESWKFTRTLAYWISVMYLEGSILFSVGAAFSMSNLVRSGEQDLEHALVATPYFMGGVCFTVGSYLGVFEAINSPNNCGPKRWFLPLTRSGWQNVNVQAAAGYSSYTVGALFFNVNTVAGFMTISPWASTVFVWLAATLGATGFLVGSSVECQCNKVWEMRVFTGAWGLSVSNFLGSIGFLVAGIAGLFRVEGSAEEWAVNFSYLVGSLFFMFGALFCLWLWKGEQYGLGFMPELNLGPRTREPNQALVLSMHEEYGCGRASAWQLPFLTMYLTSATASVLLIGLAITDKNSKYVSAFFLSGVTYEVLEAMLNFALSHGVMLLGSVVHHIPTARPHNWLLIYMRIVLTLFFVNSWYNVKRHIEEHS